MDESLVLKLAMTAQKFPL
jgi:hypothetical protein